ncbi:MAG: carboxymuconolactone decarboxylase family protein [Bacteroidota bacterium]
MTTFNVPTRETAPEAARPIFDALKQQVGMVPNLYATAGYSPATLKASLDFSHAVEGNAFRQREVQAINLVVSQVNDCSYCLAAHTTLAKMNGFSEADTFDLRTATYDDAKLGPVLRLAKELTEGRGRASDAAVQAFFNADYDNAALIELIALVSMKTFWNYVHNTTDVPVDFPAAQPLPALEVA